MSVAAVPAARPESELLDDLERWVAIDRSPSAAALRDALLPALRAAQAAAPTWAPLHQLAARALDVAAAAAARGDSAPAAREALARSIAAERGDRAAAVEAVAQTALALLREPAPWIATLSDTPWTRAALEAAHRAGRGPRVLAAESRPRLEGRRLAAGLAAAGLPVWVVADAALPLLVSQARLAWIGADAVTDRGVVHRIGSYALALAAREHSVPVYALADRRAFLPAATPALRIPELPAEELWEEPPAGVRARNVVHELVPLELLRGIVVEDGVIGAAEAAVVALERSLPAELAGAG